MNKILVLYSELADYIINSLSLFSQKYQYEIHIVHWPVNKEAPFELNTFENVFFYNKSHYRNSELKRLAQKINPKAVITAGWIDKDYLKIVYSLENAIKIMSLDTHWEGKIKQHFLKAISPFTLRKIFNYAWAIGKPQIEYSKKLGFENEEILDGFYVGNLSNTHKRIYKHEKNFVFTGRYIEHKGIMDLWEAFTELSEEQRANWKLHCYGTGELWDKRAIHPDIIHHGFIQPYEFNKKLVNGVFVLPSHFEPWGVVVHEFCQMGYPLLLSDKVGSKYSFLNENGLEFASGNKESLKQKMLELINADIQEINKMSRKSLTLSTKINNDNWCRQLINIINKKA